MTYEAEILLLVLAANGGTMDAPDARREFDRVMALTPQERDQWRKRAVRLTQAHARRLIGGGQ